MPPNNRTIDCLKLKLSSALKNKLHKENEALTLRNKEKLYSEELALIKSEIDFTTDQLQNLKDQLHHTRHQTSLVNLCSTTEKFKAESLITNLNNHKRKIDELHDRVNNTLEIQKIEQALIEEEQQKAKRAKELQVAKNEQLLREAIATEKECDTIERECTVLKKRNHAIMLKLRRKLVETENLRKELMNKNYNKSN